MWVDIYSKDQLARGYVPEGSQSERHALKVESPDQHGNHRVCGKLGSDGNLQVCHILEAAP